MPRHLSTVEDVFELGGRGSVIVVPGIPGADPGRVRQGDPITLERPDGSRLETFVQGVGMLRPADPNCLSLLLGPGLTRRDVPVGTELWLPAGAIAIRTATLSAAAAAPEGAAADRREANK